ncbi:hypothetical protein [Parabacteroides johnsonii]|uniref:hypothetical protein n=1 Tax=Parabacteroides johnsonii TaxID=387661 RepID=UPI00242E9B4E|nr:hypothetical protein [Parabacteroides johnsonii]MBS6224778.1 hypothetical protein [Parabacteroides johnsonii]
MNGQVLEDGTLYFLPRFISDDNKFVIGYENASDDEGELSDSNPIVVLAEI